MNAISPSSSRRSREKKWWNHRNKRENIYLQVKLAIEKAKKFLRQSSSTSEEELLTHLNREFSNLGPTQRQIVVEVAQLQLEEEGVEEKEILGEKGKWALVGFVVTYWLLHLTLMIWF